MGMSIRAYAQHRGVSHEAVRKAIAAGRIHKEADGSIDPAKADAQWLQHTRPAPLPSAKNVATRVATPVATSRPSTAPPTPSAGDEARGVDYHKARAVRETYAARLAKLEFEERSDKLVSKDEVDAKVFTLARQLRDRMQQIPNKVAPEIVALVVDKPDVRGVADLIDRAIHQALEELVA